MSGRIRGHMRSNVIGYIALFFAVSGTALATHPGGTNTISSGDIINNQVRALDIANNSVNAGEIIDGAVGSPEIGTGAVASAEVLDDTQAGGGLAATDLGPNSVGQSEIATDGVAALEIQDNAIDSGEIIDFSLTNQDVGVLFAQVNADGTVANSSGGVTVTKVGAGTYAVDYARNITSCAFVTTQGEAGAGGAGGAITGNTDRSGNVEATFTTTRTDANVLADRAFQQVVVC